MTDLIKLVKQPDGVWTTKVDGLDHEVQLDESKLIIWRTLGLHPTEAVEVSQTNKGEIISFTTLRTNTELKEVEFSKNHVLHKVMNIRHPYFG